MTDKITPDASGENPIAPDSPQADALFAHLQELVDALPTMEEKGGRLAKARAAREVLRLERYRKGQENELRHIQENFDAQMAIEREAKAAGDGAREENARYNVLLFGNQRGIRQGAEANARRKVDDALDEGGFSDMEEARKAALPDEDFSALEQEVESFKADYAETLQACQGIMGEEEA